MTANHEYDEYWRRGVPLSEARWRYALEPMRRRYSNPKLSRRLNPKSGMGMLAKYRDEAGQQKLLRLQRLYDDYTGRDRARRDMEDAILEQLHCGKLLAVGFRKNDKVNASPVAIPLRLLQNRYFNWFADTVSCPPHEFLMVKISRVKTGSKIKESSNAKESSKAKETIPPKRGRRPIDGLLRPLVRRLKNQGALGGKSQKEKINSVRDLAREEHSNVFPKASQPSKDKIIEALKAEGE